MHKKKFFVSLLLAVSALFLITACNNSSKDDNPVITPENVAEVFTFGDSLFYLMKDGSLYAWGDNFYGQLGVDKNVITGRVYAPEKVNIPGFVQDLYIDEVKGIDDTHYSVYAFTSDGSIYAWGDNFYGQLGLGSIFFGSQVDTPFKINLPGSITALEINNYSVYALMQDGSLYAWGNNDSGQLGLGDNENKKEPVKVSLPAGVKEITGGTYAAYAVLNDGSLYVWGANNYGQLGLNITDEFIYTPKKVDLTGSVKSINADTSVYAIMDDGSLYAWGNNISGQVGSGNTERFCTAPGKVNITGNIQDIIILDNEAAVYAVTDEGLYAWGSNLYGVLGVGSTEETVYSATKVNITGSIKDFITDVQAKYAVMDDGSLYAWGWNYDSRLGIGSDEEYIITPGKVNLPAGIKEIVVNGRTVYTILADGSLYGWGYNQDGLLCTGDNANKNTPVKINIVESSKRVMPISADVYVITDEGSLYSWGFNETGNLGSGSFDRRFTPEKVELPGSINMLYINQNYNQQTVLAVMADGSLYSWGSNEYGKLGTGSNDEYITLPAKVGLAGSVDYIISHNPQVVYAVMTDDLIYSWGLGDNGQLGLGENITSSNKPEQIQFK